jgi:hypothetical protein
VTTATFPPNEIRPVIWLSSSWRFVEPPTSNAAARYSRSPQAATPRHSRRTSHTSMPSAPPLSARRPSPEGYLIPAFALAHDSPYSPMSRNLESFPSAIALWPCQTATPQHRSHLKWLSVAPLVFQSSKAATRPVRCAFTFFRCGMPSHYLVEFSCLLRCCGWTG